MRIIRTVIVGLLAALLGLSAFASAPVQAQAGSTTAQSDRALPKRTIEEIDPGDHPLNYNTFLLKGTVTELQADAVTYLPYAKKKVQLQRKICVKKKGCDFKTISKFKTNSKGKFRVKLKALESGRTRYRVKVKGSKGYSTTKGLPWVVGFK